MQEHRGGACGSQPAARGWLERRLRRRRPLGLDLAAARSRQEQAPEREPQRPELRLRQTDGVLHPVVGRLVLL
eukprot:COSAG06_NODE_47007_length_342_cov_1.259259_1_plen_72_part_10